MKRGVATCTLLLCNDFDTEIQRSLPHIKTPVSLFVSLSVLVLSVWSAWFKIERFTQEKQKNARQEAKKATVRRGFSAYLCRSMTDGSLSLVFAVNAVIGCGWEF